MRTATEEFTAALVLMASEGERPRCGDHGTSYLWTSEELHDRMLAKRWCAGCPVIDKCHAAAEEHGEAFGVWAGIDRSTNKAKLRLGPRREGVAHE